MFKMNKALANLQSYQKKEIFILGIYKKLRKWNIDDKKNAIKW